MELYKALEELHVEFKDLPLEQYRARDRLPLMQQWPRGRADDRVTLSSRPGNDGPAHDSNTTANQR